MITTVQKITFQGMRTEMNLKVNNKVLHEALENYLFEQCLSFWDKYCNSKIVIHHLSYKSTGYLQLEVEIRLADNKIEFKRITLN